MPTGVTSPGGNGVPGVIIPSTVIAKAVHILITSVATLANTEPLSDYGPVSSADAVTFLVFVPVEPGEPGVTGGSDSLPGADGPGAAPVGVENGVRVVGANFQ